MTAVEFYIVFVAIDEDGKPVVDGSDGTWPPPDGSSVPPIGRGGVGDG